MRSLTVRASVLGAWLALAGCGGSDNGPLLSWLPEGVAAPCATAFDDVGASASKTLLLAKNESVVLLSSLACKPDALGNVTIGGDGGCGPRVVIDQSFTVKKGNALGK